MTDQTPIVPLIRQDGWTAGRKLKFLDQLAHEGSVRSACGRVGMSREAAYQLRRRDALFARAWNAALVLAREASAEVLACRAIHGVEEDVWYKGELVGTRRKYDSRLLLAHVARLDRIAADERADRDAGRFDELLARVAGERVPGEIEIDDDLPPTRDETIAIARAIATDDWEQLPEERSDDDLDAAQARRMAEAAVRWDDWLTRACATVDGMLAAPPAAPDGVSSVSGVSTSRVGAGVAAAPLP
jgi:hypothetical protein